MNNSRNLLITAVLLIVLGLVLMSGLGSDFTHFESDIFSFRRTTLAPIVCLLGYLLVIVAIVIHKDTATCE